MLTLYFSPGACSMAAHIVLEESGEAFLARPIILADGQQRSEAYLKINPQGRVPTLVLDDGEPLLENTAILPYLGKRFGLWPKDLISEARILSLIGFLSASVHPSFTHFRRPERYSADLSSLSSIKARGRETFCGYLELIDTKLAGRSWFSNQYSVADVYLLVFYHWGARIDYPMAELKHFTAVMERLLCRPAVQRVLAKEHIEL